MSKLWDDLKNHVKEWGSVAVEKAEEVSKIAVAKTEELTKISKLKIDIRHLQKDQSSAHEKLGQFVVKYAQEDNLVNFTGNAEFFTYVKEIGELKELIDLKNKDIQKIKSEYDLNESDIVSTVTIEEESKTLDEEQKDLKDEEIIMVEEESSESSMDDSSKIDESTTKMEQE